MTPVGLLRLMACSLNQGPFELITGVTVTPPVPPPVSFTGRLIVVVRVRPPPVPVTVTAAAPRVAVPEAVNVNTLLVPGAGFVPKLALTPLGNPLALNVTSPVKPPVRVTVIVLVPLAPRLIVRLVGLGESEKSGFCGWYRVRLNVVVCVRPSPVPVTVTVAAPRWAAVEGVILTSPTRRSSEFVPKLALTPLGNPLALKVTPLVKPPVRVIVIVLVPLAPRLIVKLEGLDETEKSGLETPLGSP